MVSQDNLTHWLIPHRRQTLLSYCREARPGVDSTFTPSMRHRDVDTGQGRQGPQGGARGAREGGRGRGRAEAAGRGGAGARAREARERAGSKPLVKDKPKPKKKKPAPPPRAKENNGAKDGATASETKKGGGWENDGRQGRRGRLQDQEGQEGRQEELTGGDGVFGGGSIRPITANLIIGRGSPNSHCSDQRRATGGDSSSSPNRRGGGRARTAPTQGRTASPDAETASPSAATSTAEFSVNAARGAHLREHLIQSSSSGNKQPQSPRSHPASVAGAGWRQPRGTSQSRSTSEGLPQVRPS